ncbi:hypothetical protein TPHA_0J02040 [Tetrapisispora phaffii CBS 4417]|uniref:5'-deoxynucleotidase n=1 Tax=Tetrapisispora phaffii (strain ATCC 24235 / CBS 4417 / NBRC 1672 / NRRL Y-8282 / UCD 70-5) TaxID=1071381 RepID=G8BYT2_TETPH|nr:hypothetical protein TPHA_0J02040 [Tetrapisispora phaffii CBS 4417]CCE65024.1 hypothetical protein TPHA_0J02040 [Tetrapisispora phaffii CBS 4417]
MPGSIYLNDSGNFELKNKIHESDIPTMTELEWRPENNIPEEIKAILKEEQPNYVLSVLNIVQLLKTQKRTGWVDFGINDCESIADHMYRMGITSMLIKDPTVNRDKCVRIALMHDLAEALVGDITPNDTAVDKDEKHRRELSTIEYICNEYIAKYNPIAAEEMLQDWLAYENISTLEARYVKDIDKFEMLVQCYEYEKKHNGEKRLDQFWSAMKAIKTDEVNEWAADLYKRRTAFFESLK